MFFAKYIDYFAAYPYHIPCRKAYIWGRIGFDGDVFGFNCSGR